MSSTGVIGQTINVKVIEDGVPELYGLLEHSDEASDAAAHAIMTTDTTKKEFAAEVFVGGTAVHIGGIAKGSGMIHPNMGTMLCFLTTAGAAHIFSAFSSPWGAQALALPLLAMMARMLPFARWSMVKMSGETEFRH